MTSSCTLEEALCISRLKGWDFLPKDSGYQEVKSFFVVAKWNLYDLLCRGSYNKSRFMAGRYMITLFLFRVDVSIVLSFSQCICVYPPPTLWIACSRMVVVTVFDAHQYWFVSLTMIFCQIEIKELDDFAQAAFHGYKYLNRIQSRIFQTVYYTNENILVSNLFCGESNV